MTDNVVVRGWLVVHYPRNSLLSIQTDSGTDVLGFTTKSPLQQLKPSRHRISWLSITTQMKHQGLVKVKQKEKENRNLNITVAVPCLLVVAHIYSRVIKSQKESYIQSESYHKESYIQRQHMWEIFFTVT
ncbi:hypothetical protein EV424DRAFT_1340850 [Suillus variegatus]|nr:hypothetical protein EV424DRAFT_1340850 [Suillus variegatus]